ncbi:hypothetical protein ALC56_08370 [Trachymyrmex septentrionalis]|uniref:Uncharacterized protein n=1 Tax=Trachymyrmex septentrionalis TaxID=34720 RepID=A0A195FAS3_9HYME|nr:hypothetical protein ALC56_08370 [Trachymyrmex septentrionalis]
MNEDFLKTDWFQKSFCSWIIESHAWAIVALSISWSKMIHREDEARNGGGGEKEREREGEERHTPPGARDANYSGSCEQFVDYISDMSKMDVAKDSEIGLEGIDETIGLSKKFMGVAIKIGYERLLHCRGEGRRCEPREL